MNDYCILVEKDGEFWFGINEELLCEIPPMYAGISLEGEELDSTWGYKQNSYPNAYRYNTVNAQSNDNAIKLSKIYRDIIHSIVAYINFELPVSDESKFEIIDF